LEFVHPQTWQFVAFTFDADSGEACLYQFAEGAPSSLSREPRYGSRGLVHSPLALTPGSVHAGPAPLLLGALPHPQGGHWAHVNGKLAAPVLLNGVRDEDELMRLALGGVSAATDALGAWDLGVEVSGTRVVDVSGNERHGIAVNSPARAVTGPRWNDMAGALYTDDPAVYDAVHLHDDDLDDARWESVCALEVPGDARPGIYALRAQDGAGLVTLPFVVRGRSPAHDLCVLLPTYTWQAYSSNRAPYSFTEDGVVDRALCIYDVHSDGSVVLYCTRRKPTRSGDPTAGIRPWGAHTLPANLYLTDWLEARSFAYEVLTDEDLHREGVDALAPFRCVVLGSHPEYWTSAMLDGLEAYLGGGGRVAHLGGNGLYWVTSIDPERSHVMEVRKSGDGDYEQYFARSEAGQMQHSTTLEVGGLWARRGRPPRRLVGVEHSANVFVPADGRWGFERQPASRDPRYAFIFAGVDDDVIGDFGLNLGTAAAYEMDSVQEWPWDDRAPPVLLARASHETFFPPMRMPVPAVCDIAFTPWPGGGAVFAAGSVAWTGSLSHNGYANSVSRITENVLRCFLETPRGEPLQAVR
jgi:N,N-dimethylformamidase